MGLEGRGKQACGQNKDTKMAALGSVVQEGDEALICVEREMEMLPRLSEEINAARGKAQTPKDQFFFPPDGPP